MSTKYEQSFIESLVAFYKASLNQARNVTLSSLDPQITHRNIVSYSTYSPWYDDKPFLETYEAIASHTLVDIYRCYELWTWVKRNAHIAGHVVEVGVWKGGTGCLLGRAVQLFGAPEERVYLADTFAGVVKASSLDTLYTGGEHSDTSVGLVEALIGRLQLSNTTILQGLFPDQVDFSRLDMSAGLRLCHIDVDTYQSAADVLAYVWPHVNRGGAVVFDDYGFWGCEGVTRLCNATAFADAAFVHNLNGHALFIKV